MKLKIKRVSHLILTTIGELSIDGSPFCFTLEDAVRAPGIKVPKYTAIEQGTYVIKNTFSERFQRSLPRIFCVPGFKGVRIHRGNSHEDTEGCVIVGYKRTTDSVYFSADAEKDLVALLGEDEHELEIINVKNY